MKPKCPRCGVTASHERVSTVMRAWFRCAECNFVWRASVLTSWRLFGDGRAVPRTAVVGRTREDEFDPAQIRLPGDRLAANAESDDAPGLESVDANLSPPPPAMRRPRHRRKRARVAKVPSTRPDADSSFLRDVNPGRDVAAATRGVASSPRPGGAPSRSGQRGVSHHRETVATAAVSYQDRDRR